MPPELPDALLAETFEDMRRIMLGMRGRFRGALIEHGLTMPQWILLRILHERGRMTTREVAEAMDVTPANVSGIVDRLEAAGFMVRSRSNDDKRVVFLRITERGHEKFDEVSRAGLGVLRTTFDGWTAAEVASFGAQLRRLRP